MMTNKLNIKLLDNIIIVKQNKILNIIISLLNNKVLDKQIYINLEKNLFYNYIYFLHNYIKINGHNNFINLYKTEFENYFQNESENKIELENEDSSNTLENKIYNLFIDEYSNYNNNFNIIELSNNEDIKQITYNIFIACQMVEYFKKSMVNNQIIIKSNNNILTENKNNLTFYKSEKDEKLSKEQNIYNAEKERITEKRKDHKNLFSHEISLLDEQLTNNTKYLECVNTIYDRLPNIIKHIKYFLTIYKSRLIDSVKQEQTQKKQIQQNLQNHQKELEKLNQQLNEINQQINLYDEKRLLINTEFYQLLQENNIKPEEWSNQYLEQYAKDPRANTKLRYKQIEKQHIKNQKAQSTLQQKIKTLQQAIEQENTKKTQKIQKITFSIHKNENSLTKNDEQTKNDPNIKPNIYRLLELFKEDINDLKEVNNFDYFIDNFDMISKMVLAIKFIDKDDCKLIYNKLLKLLEHLGHVKVCIENKIFDLTAEIKEYKLKQDNMPKLLLEQEERMEQRIRIASERFENYFLSKSEKLIKQNKKVLEDVKVIETKNNFIKCILDEFENNILFLINLFNNHNHLILEKNNNLLNHFDIILNYIISMNSSNYKNLMLASQQFYILFKNSNTTNFTDNSKNIFAVNTENLSNNDLDIIISNQPTLTSNSNEIYNSNLNILSNVKSQLSTVKKLKKT
jgi:hypothetical protein